MSDPSRGGNEPGWAQRHPLAVCAAGAVLMVAGAAVLDDPEVWAFTAFAIVTVAVALLLRRVSGRR